MRDPRGFTVVEVLATLGLLGILLLVAMPQLTAPDELEDLTLADQIATDLRLARQLAIAARVPYLLEFNPAAPPYTSYTVRAAASVTAEPDFPKDIPAGVTVGGRRQFIFLPSGCVDDDGAGACAGSDGQVSVGAGAYNVLVRVFWYRGRVRVELP